MNRQSLIRFTPLAVIGLVLVFFAKLAFSNLILARGDTYAYFYPYWHTAAEALQAGRLPLWNDLIFMGAPLLANSQVGLLYPPNWPLWLLAPDAPTAIKGSILLHIMWAGLGTFALLRGPLKLGPLAALTGAALFAVGGQLTAHAEQVNQLQGLAWLPWLFLCLDRARQHPWRWGPLLAAALALQLLSGHTQTIFISLIGLGVMALWWTAFSSQPSADSKQPSAKTALHRLRPLLVLVGAGSVALALALPQLAPTLELIGLSNRSGGLTFDEVVSFSLHPALIGRALLPNYDVTLHGEYIGTIGLAGLALALLGAWQGRKDRRWQGWILLAALGLFLAPGGWNPVYWLLGRLPGFNLFRVPARWLILWALGASVLAAYAIQRWRDGDLTVPRPLLMALGGIALALLSGTFLSPLVDDISISGTTRPTITALALWLATAGVILLLLRWRHGKWTGIGLAGLAVLELFIASGQMPYNRLTAPDAFTATRPTVHQLTTRADDTTPPGRFLSLSNIMFGPNDQPVLQAVYGDQLPADALYDLLIATKLKDILAPNLGMVWGLPSADGFGGGVLPLATYTRFSELLLPDPPPDGRLRENLTAIPDPDWLDLMGVQYVIADRVNDLWIDGVYYDLSWETALNERTITINDLPDFEATALGVVYTAEETSTDLAAINIFPSGETHSLASAPPIDGTPYSLAVIPFVEAQSSTSIQLAGNGMTVHGIALIDERTGAFETLPLYETWRLIHASDVKIYANHPPAPRAFMIYEAEIIPDDDAAITRLSDPDFHPHQTVILAEGEPLAGGSMQPVPVARYEPETVEMAVSTRSDGYLVLADAYYPGWTATLDGEPVPIYQADIMFRAVFVPAGEHTLTMSFTPTSWPGALLVGVGAWIAVVVVGIAAWLTARPSPGKS